LKNIADERNCICAGDTACGFANNENTLHVGEREEPWLDMMQQSIESLPADEDAFIREMIPRVDTERFILAEYDLENLAS